MRKLVKKKKEKKKCKNVRFIKILKFIQIYISPWNVKIHCVVNTEERKIMVDT